MSRLAALTLAAGLVCASAPAISHAADVAKPTTQALLKDALLCQGDPLDIIDKLVAQGSSGSDPEFTAAAAGEEMDKLSVITLRSPLEIEGAKTPAILQTFAQTEDFGALVYGRFQGDYRKVVSALKLVPTAEKDGLRLGHFTRAVTTGDETCPMTIALTPLADGDFLLGCGWCNG